MMLFVGKFQEAFLKNIKLDGGKTDWYHEVKDKIFHEMYSNQLEYSYIMSYK